MQETFTYLVFCIIITYENSNVQIVHSGEPQVQIYKLSRGPQRKGLISSIPINNTDTC
jgi:hypothetical protein